MSNFQINEKSYSVWVGGFEVHDYYLTKVDAAALAQEYIELGHDDVCIEYFPHINGDMTL